MKNTILDWVLKSFFLLFVVSEPTVASEQKNQVIIVYDAFGKPSKMIKDWGFSVYIVYNGKRILFDTGNNEQILEHNLNIKGINPKNLDFVVISHRHDDHITGLNYITTVNPSVKIYVPQENFSVFGASLPGTFYKQDKTLPIYMRYFDGKPPITLTFGSAWPQGNFQIVNDSTEIIKGFHLIKLKGSWGVDLDVMELSLAIDTPDGTVLIVGCSHPTIEKIVEVAQKITNKPIHLLLGGTHLLPLNFKDAEIVAKSLNDKWKVRWVAPAHCTGEPAFSSLKSIFSNRYIYAGLGTTIKLGSIPKVTSCSDCSGLLK